MELDSLKEAWGKQETTDLITKNTDIMELVQHKSYGPIATIKRKLTWQLVPIPIFLGVILLQIIIKPALLDKFKVLFSEQPLFMWGASAAMILLVAQFGFSYILLQKVQKTDLSIKGAVEKNLTLFEKSLKAQRVVGIIILTIFILLIEFGNKLPGKEFDLLFSLNSEVRTLLYVAVLVFYFYFSKIMFQRQFGQHINFLKETLSKLND